MQMDVKTYSPELQENRKPISILTTRMNSIVDSIDQLRLTMDHMIETQCKMKTKIDKISDKVFEKPDYLSVGEIALKEGVSDRTVRRRLKEKIIPFEKTKEKKLTEYQRKIIISHSPVKENRIGFRIIQENSRTTLG